MACKIAYVIAAATLFASSSYAAEGDHNTKELYQKAVAVIHPIQDSKVEGIVYFTQEDKGVKIQAVIKGLKPGQHGLHIHQYGDCSSLDGSAAGGHFNPGEQPHGSPEAAKRHEGDLGNLEANEQGVALYERTDNVIALNGPHSIIGRAVIIHEKADDFTTQPTGNAGGRLGCGVIGIGQ